MLKAPRNYLNTMTSTRKNLKQITFMADAGGQINWLADLEAAFTTINKSAPTLKNEKWVASKQHKESTKILTALVKVRKHFLERAAKNEATEVIEEQHDSARNPIWQLGKYTPTWMQRLARDALFNMPCLALGNFTVERKDTFQPPPTQMNILQRPP